MLVRLFLVGLCAPPNHCDGIPTRADYLVELDKVRDNKNLLNLLVWKVATDPLVTREDGALNVSGRMIVVVVETDLANRNDRRIGRELVELAV